MPGGRAGQTGGVTSTPEPVEITVDGPEARAALAGEFDMNATFTVEPALEAVLDEPGLERLDVDLSGLTFIDSTGMGVLLRLQEAAARRELGLTLVPAPPQVQRVFETAGLLDALPFADANRGARGFDG
jgi:stage II sporulation protein AA (anti-sigma F factor antagonist)